jgi:lipopolysaccharide/colanic/teichoic acid biosynthesis glycosyltransferase
MIGKRLFDIVFSGAVLLVASPVLIIFAALVKLSSPGPVLYRQVRVGIEGKPFRILKFRSMRVDADQVGPLITIGADPRITGIGHFLRRFKLDELPQFINVLVGDMSVVGPRPEVPRYVAEYPQVMRDKILGVRPGITDPAAITFCSENEMLAGSDEPEKLYVTQILPAKLALACDYIEQRSFSGDIVIVAKTMLVMLGLVRKSRRFGQGSAL